jgi:hypothetical protein
MSAFWITTSDRQRAAKWERIFGSDRLPVLSTATRWDTVDGHERPCYDLALGALSTGQRDRLAAYAARRLARPYDTVRREIEAAISWPVSAAGCVVVIEEQATADTRPSPFLLFPDSVGRMVRRLRALRPVARA